jgi:anti-sigma-K factor RskA
MVEAYALGALDPQERAAMEAHLAAGCEECARALGEARWVVSQLAYAAPAAEPSEMLKARLIQTVRSDAKTAAPTSGRSSAAKSAVPVWLWAGVAALLVMTMYSAWDARKLRTDIKDMNERAATALRENQNLQKQLAIEQREARILTDPNSKKIMLPAQDKDMPQLEAMWNAQLGIVITGQKIPMPSGNRGLQLWLIPKKDGAKPMPSQMIWPDANGKVMHLVENPPDEMWNTKALAVSAEPAGGSPQPTSTPMWVGGLS